MPKKRAKTEIKPEAQETEATTSGMSPGNFETTAVVGLPKFHPHVRPVTTEQVSGVPVRQSYEQVQESTRGAGVEQWREVDRARAELGELYRNLKEDARYSEEYKAETAWRQYEQTREKIEALVPEARSKMLKSAETLERLSIPVPEKQGLVTQDSDKLLLTAHERNRLEGLINRAERQAKGPFKVNPVDILAREYARGLDEGGPGGGATVRATIQLARDFGFDVNIIVDKHRKPHHHGALENAQAARMQAQMVGRSVPQPPFRRGGGSHKDTGTKAFIPQQKGVLFQKRRRPAWK
jgi:hypothetical protein